MAGDHDSVDRIIRRHAVPAEAALRGFEWRFIKSLQPVPTNVLFEANDRINDVVVTPDGAHLFLCDAAGGIACIDVVTGRPVLDIHTKQDVIYDIDLSSNNILAAAGDMGRVSLFRWDNADRTYNHLRQIVLGKSAILAVASRTDGKHLWAGSNDGQIFEIDVRTGRSREVYRFPKPKSIHDLIVLPDDRLLVAQQNRCHELAVDHLTDDRRLGSLGSISPNEEMLEVRGIDLSKDGAFVVMGQLLGLVSLVKRADVPATIDFSQLITADVHSVAITSDGKWLAAGDAAGYIHLLPAEINHREAFLDSSTSRNRRMRSWKAHDGKIEQLLFFSDTEYDGAISLYSAGRDGRLVVSKPFSSSSDFFASCEELPVSFASISARCNSLWDHRVYGISLPETNDDNHRILTAKEDIRYYNVPERNQFGILLNGHKLLLGDKDLKDLSSNEAVWQAAPHARAVRCAIARDASKFALCVERTNPRRHRIELYETGNPNPIQVIRSHLTNDATFSPAADRFAYVLNNDVMVLDSATGEPLHRLCQHTDAIQDLGFSPDGKQLASVSSDRHLAVWDVASGELLWSQRAHENRSLTVAFHPYLSTLATVGADAVVRFWSTRTLVSHDSVRLVGEFPLDVGACAAAAFSADGQSLFIRHKERGVTELRAQMD